MGSTLRGIELVEFVAVSQDGIELARKHLDFGFAQFEVREFGDAQDIFACNFHFRFPFRRFRRPAGAASRRGVFIGHVVVDERLELGGELVVGAVQAW